MEGSILLLGACGMGMAPLALYLKQSGVSVWVADDAPNAAVVGYFERLGIPWLKEESWPAGITQVVYSPAVGEGHSLRKIAVAKGIPQMCRGLFLAKYLEGKRLVAIVGSHGKTTTTALLIHALKSAPNFKFSYLLGGLFRDKALLPAHYDKDAEWVVAEIDESDGTIEAFSPEIVLALNLDWDHPGYYTSEGLLDQTFKHLFEQTQGAIFIAAESKRLLALAQGLNVPVHTFSLGDFGDFSVEVASGETQVLLLQGGRKAVAIELPLQGDFNALNAVGALAVADKLQVDLTSDIFKGYTGVARRQDKLFEGPHVTVWADYAHHPVEIAAFLNAFKEPGRRIIGVFQPHRYTRTAQYAADFAHVLEDVDVLFLLPVYAASEVSFPEGQTEAIAAFFKEKAVALFDSQDPALLEAIQAACEVPSTVLFMGAGDIEQVASAFVEQQVKLAGESDDFLKMIIGTLLPETIFREQEPLGVKTTLRVGGLARYYAEPTDEKDLVQLITKARQIGLPYFILGRGSNLLVPDEGYAGLVIRLAQPKWQMIERLGEDRVWVGGGVRLKELCGQAATWGLQGFEFLEGIPGSIGGALRMNAGAMGGWMFDVVEAVEVLTADGQIQQIPKAAFTIGYRVCEELKTAVALRALLKGVRVEVADEVKAKMLAFSTSRKASQPREPSAGCMFKNPEGDYAGRLVEASGLKGFSVGGAKVSPVHGNFVVNQGGATATDIFNLVHMVHAKVGEVQGVWLEPEVMILGGAWATLLPKR